MMPPALGGYSHSQDLRERQRPRLPDY